MGLDGVSMRPDGSNPSELCEVLWTFLLNAMGPRECLQQGSALGQRYQTLAWSQFPVTLWSIHTRWLAPPPAALLSCPAVKWLRENNLFPIFLSQNQKDISIIFKL